VISLSAAEVQKIAASGSPALLNIAGRAFGLGQAETNALVKGNIPTWFWATAGVLGGIAIGIQVCKRWPDKIPEFLK
jgi:hypothetical protein